MTLPGAGQDRHGTGPHAVAGADRRPGRGRRRAGLLLRGTLVGMGVVAAFTATLLGACRRSVPNVLLVVLDTTRADRCSLHGYARPTTPRLDAFARDAVVFDDAWSPAPWTVPAHGTLFTGVPPTVHGLGPRGVRVLAPERVTIAERLREKGVRTGLFAANPFVSAAFGLDQGFDTDDRTWRQPRAGMPPPPATRVTDAALRWIADRRDRDESWFACLNLCDPHAPYDPPEEFSRRLRRSSLESVPAEPALRALRHPATAALSLGATPPLSPAQKARLDDLYDAEIAAADDALGRLLDALEAEGDLEETLVIVVGDHGEGLLDHGWMEHGAFLHREMLRVPLLVRFPGRFEGGARRADLVRLEDVAATILSVHGLALPAAPGVGVALDEAPAPDASPRPTFATEEPQPAVTDLVRQNGWNVDDRAFRRSRSSVYDGRWHLIADSGGRVELYDVASDPAERTDLSASRPDEVQRLRVLLEIGPR